MQPQENQKRKLLVISCSKIKKRIHNSPAIEVYDGPYYRILRRNNLSNIDILIISAKYGIIDSNQMISYYNRRMNKGQALKLRTQVSEMLNKKLSSVIYEEVFFELGRNYLDAVDLNPSIYPETKFIFDRGTIGIRLHNFKSWLEQCYR